MKIKQRQKRIIILGSTGSIGKNALNIIKSNPKIFKAVGLSCYSQADTILEQADYYKPKAIVIVKEANIKLPAIKGMKISQGTQGLLEMIHTLDADMVLNAISGSNGLIPSMAAIESRKDLALANKESIVMAGSLILEQARRNKVNIIPVDSEHSALFFLLQNKSKEVVTEIILTASGGAFLNRSLAELKHATVSDALKHPNWNMGAKITIDSATLANKALEVIEAKYFFNIDISKIKVVIHPQSYVHSLIRTRDGSLYAQLSKPDMRIPIQNALTYPDILPVGYGKLDLVNCNLNFLPVDKRKYRMLSLGYKAAELGGAYPIVFNASNEIAVDKFMASELSFLDICRITEKTLNLDWRNPVSTLEEVLAIHGKARQKALSFIEKER